MNIDILNAYCGHVLVACPCLGQGRLNIHQNALRSALGCPTSLTGGGWPQVDLCSALPNDSWVVKSLGLSRQAFTGDRLPL